MGTFKWPLRISSMDGQRVLDIEAMVGTGAFYTTLPASLLRELGIEPRGKRRVPLADGRRIDLDYGQASVLIDGGCVTTLVVFGENDSQAVLGTYTLDGLALTVDPLGQRLIPKPLIMYSTQYISPQATRPGLRPTPHRLSLAISIPLLSLPGATPS